MESTNFSQNAQPHQDKRAYTTHQPNTHPHQHTHTHTQTHHTNTDTDTDTNTDTDTDTDTLCLVLSFYLSLSPSFYLCPLVSLSLRPFVSSSHCFLVSLSQKIRMLMKTHMIHQNLSSLKMTDDRNKLRLQMFLH